MSSERTPSGAWLLSVRYRGWLFLLLLTAPMLMVLARFGFARDGMNTGLGLPLAGEGRVETWVLISMYAGVLTAPLLCWQHSDIEASAPAFLRRSFYGPQALAVLMALTTLAAVVSVRVPSGGVFWVSTSMATAAFWAILLRSQAWVGGIASALLGLCLILQGRLDVWHPAAEAAGAALACAVLWVATLVRQRRLLVRPR